MSLNSRRTEREREKDLGNSTIVSLISGSPPLPLPPPGPPSAAPPPDNLLCCRLGLARLGVTPPHLHISTYACSV